MNLVYQYKLVDQSEVESARIAKVLDHPVRQRIIELLGEKGSMPWKELSFELGIGTGSLYYHVDTLEGIVSRDSARRFALTKTGTAVYEYLRQNPLVSPSRPIPLSLTSQSAGRRFLSAVFWPRPLVSRLTSSTPRALETLAVLSALFLAISVYLGDSLNLLFFAPGRGPLLVAGGYPLSLGALVLVGYVMTRALFGSRPSLVPLAAASAFCLIPVVALGLALPALQGVIPRAAGKVPITLALVFVQGWSASLLGAGISVSSGLRIEKAILVSLTILYATLAVMFAQGAVL